jgi:hypothetical protein
MRERLSDLHLDDGVEISPMDASLVSAAIHFPGLMFGTWIEVLHIHNFLVLGLPEFLTQEVVRPITCGCSQVLTILAYSISRHALF